MISTRLLVLASLLSAGCGGAGGGAFYPVYDFDVAPGDLASPPGPDGGGVDLALPPVADLAAPPDLAQPQDFAMAPPDFARTSDLAGPLRATINEIDTGRHPDGTRVVISNVVLTGVTLANGTTKNKNCRYQAWVQDPAGPAPSGIKLYASGPQCTTSDGGGCRCPFAPLTTTPLDATTVLGDVFTVEGEVGVFVPAVADGALLPPQHEIVVSRVTRTGGGGLIKPVVINNGLLFASGAPAYQSYEGMLITIRPGFRFTIGQVSQYGEFDGAGAHFIGDYRAFYGAMGTFPMPNSSWSAVTGIANPAFNGGIAPRDQSDFVP